MAMADRRPLGIPVASAHALPAFNAGSLLPSMKPTISDLKGPFSENDIAASDKSPSPTELSPTLRSVLPDLLMALTKKSTSSVLSRDLASPEAPLFKNGPVLGKKPKPTTRVPIATGISTTIPVTGEKPKPEQEGDTLLEDDVLFAIFLILYEKDPEGVGMTVKQICDVLVERHPDMAQLLSKTLNLVSAKLNAYVKRVEKGDANLKYALLREWADALPKRMVYVYRGLLAKDFHVHVKHAMETKPAKFGASFVADSFEQAKQLALKPRRLTMFDLGANRPQFSDLADKSNLFVPYLSAPVAANLALHEDDDPVVEVPRADSDYDFDDLEVFTDDELFGLAEKRKRSKSMSYLQAKKPKVLTAAAAAPRAPKTPCSHSPNAAAAAAALHAAALKAIAAATDSKKVASPKKSNWAHAVRLGFLTQEIGAPEEVSLAELDKFFS